MAAQTHRVRESSRPYDAINGQTERSRTSREVASSRRKARARRPQHADAGDHASVLHLGHGGLPDPAPWASAAPDRPASARNARRRAPSTFIRSCRSLPIPRVLHHRTKTTPKQARAVTTEARHDSNFLYCFKAARSARRALPGSPPGPDAPAFGPLWPRLRRSRGWSEHHGGEKPAVAGAVGSTALATSPVRVPRRARPGGHSFKFRAGSQPARVAGQRTAP